MLVASQWNNNADIIISATTWSVYPTLAKAFAISFHSALFFCSPCFT